MHAEEGVMVGGTIDGKNITKQISIQLTEISLQNPFVQCILIDMREPMKLYKREKANRAMFYISQLIV